MYIGKKKRKNIYIYFRLGLLWENSLFKNKFICFFLLYDVWVINIEYKLF